MALADEVTGDGYLVSSSSTSTSYRVVTAASGVYKYTQTKTQTVHRWVALTASAATTWLEGEKAEGESRAISEDQRVLGSYIAEKTTETITLTSAPWEPEA